VRRRVKRLRETQPSIPERDKAKTKVLNVEATTWQVIPPPPNPPVTRMVQIPVRDLNLTFPRNSAEIDTEATRAAVANAFRMAREHLVRSTELAAALGVGAEMLSLIAKVQDLEAAVALAPVSKPPSRAI
jgi:hypothetical protein